ELMGTRVKIAIQSWRSNLRFILRCAIALLIVKPAFCADLNIPGARFQKRWLFIWRDLTKPEEVERMIARFPAAAAAGYNGVVFSYNIAPSKAGKLRETAKQHGLVLIAIVMGNAHDRNYT